MNKNTRLLLILLAIVVGMCVFAYSFVPLYRTFCQAFGIPVPSVLVGEAGAAKDMGDGEVSDRVITVRFIGNQAAGVPVVLEPVVHKIKLRLGEYALTAYTGTNTTNKSLDGVAVHTIVAFGRTNSEDVQEYVDLQQCFCFTEQHYPANTTVNLPLSFAVSPNLPEGIHTLTFGYTLFEDPDAGDAKQTQPLGAPKL